jgi:predicted ATP-dependent endonuclease of OLD family
MSKANGTLEKKDTYLQHVSLKNYKSIKDVEIDFKPGLNIIIGKNASGKTNFVNGLDMILNFKYDELIDTESFIVSWFKNTKIEIQALNDTQSALDSLKADYYNSLIYHKMLLKVDDQLLEVDDYDDVKNKLFDKEWFFNGVLIKYGNHYKEKSLFVNMPFSFVIVNNERVSRELMTVTMDDNRTEFIQYFFHRLYMHLVIFFSDKGKGEVSSEALKAELITFSIQYFSDINNLISNYSPIKAIRLNPDFNVINEESAQKKVISNFYLEFLINENWVTFNLLSDGTKRLFYIISELLSSYYSYGNSRPNNDLNIFLIEEPELGIHPHQLHLLLQFIKEQSRYKQIIITTHSPQVLDTLEPDELDRIIICSHDPKNGTQLNHLTDKQRSKASKYMKAEAFLSDYWRFSDLEPA